MDKKTHVEICLSIQDRNVMEYPIVFLTLRVMDGTVWLPLWYVFCSIEEGELRLLCGDKREDESR